MKRALSIFVITSAFLAQSCGTKPGGSIGITFSGKTTAFSDPAATDLIFEIKNQQGQLFVYPTVCCPGLANCSYPANCGFPVTQKGSVTVGDLPLNAVYQVDAFVRNAARTILYNGSAQLTNDGTITTLNIPIKVNP